MQKQLLFVDDERNVLDGLRRLLRPFRNEWSMHFALSGEQALEVMASCPIDVIVTDMRMPRMNGAELLSEVMKRYPGTIRIILSGQADDQTIMRSIGIAHQYLSKPCDPETLEVTVSRATRLRSLLANSYLQSLVSQMRSLPSIPSLYFQIVRELQSDEPSIQQISKIISGDPAMTAKILQVANSAFFGRRREVASPTEAVSYLGLDRIQHLVLSVHAFSQFQVSADSTLSMDNVWKHSTATALLAKRICDKERIDKGTSQEAFTAGMLHDLGKSMLASRLPEQYNRVMEASLKTGTPLYEVENDELESTHADVGAYLLGLWGLPDAIVEAVAYHHRPAQCPGQDFSALTAVHLSDALLEEQEGRDRLDSEYVGKLGLTDRIASWKGDAHEVRNQAMTSPC